MENPSGARRGPHAPARAPSGAAPNASLTPPGPSVESDFLRRRRSPMSSADFDIEAMVGKGGYGEVYLCRKRDTNEVLALKRMNKRILFRKNQVASIKVEREVMSRVQEGNPWVVPLRYSFQDANWVYLAMDFIPGGDLRTLLNSYGTLRESHCRFYIAEMLTAVLSLHTTGYIHRDIKPENLLVSRTGHMMLTDFGLSKGGVEEQYRRLCSGVCVRCRCGLTPERPVLFFALRKLLLDRFNAPDGYRVRSNPISWLLLGRP